MPVHSLVRSLTRLLSVQGPSAVRVLPSLQGMDSEQQTSEKRVSDEGWLLGWLSGKESACQSRRTQETEVDPRVGRIPGEGNQFQYSLLENPMDRGAWQATSPWGCKESDMTEQQHTRKDDLNIRATPHS